MSSRNQAHVFHLQSPSFAQHMALQSYYEGIIPLIDGLVESFQGRYGILRGYAISPLIKEDDSTLQYFEALCKFVYSIRETIPQDTYIQNQIDEVVELIESTKYKLKFLR
jgi:hypothetical protein